MTEGTTKSEESRDEEQGKHSPEARVMEGVTRALNAVDLAQPEPIDSPEAGDIPEVVLVNEVVEDDA
jgi:hypothetical protein